jgi:hypothetical protein
MRNWRSNTNTATNQLSTINIAVTRAQRLQDGCDLFNRTPREETQIAKRKRRISDEIKPCQIKTLITLNIRNKITLACVKFNHSSYFLLLQATIFPNKKKPIKKITSCLTLLVTMLIKSLLAFLLLLIFYFFMLIFFGGKFCADSEIVKV